MIVNVVTNVVTGVKEVTVRASADVFIIPNRASRMANMPFLTNYTKKVIANTFAANGLEFNENSKLVQLWWVSKSDLETNNLADHGCKINMPDGSVERLYAADLCPIGLVPKELLVGFTEGESKEFRFDIMHESTNMIVHMVLTATASQTKYRYSKYGTFEDTLRHVSS